MMMAMTTTDHIAILAKAYESIGNTIAATVYANADYKVVRAAVYAVLPGKQNKKNIAQALDAAVKAAARAIRRRK